MAPYDLTYILYDYRTTPNLVGNGRSEIRATCLLEALAKASIDSNRHRQCEKVALVIWRDHYGRHNDLMLFGDGRMESNKIKVRWG